MTANTLKSRSASRIFYYALSAVNYIALLLGSDVFLVDVLQYAGFGDGTIGIISSSLGFTSFVQILLLFIGHRIRRRKAIIMFGYTGVAAMFALMHVIAVAPADAQIKQFLIVACLLIGRLAVNFSSPVLEIFKYSFISYRERGTVSATNSTVSLATAIVFTLAIGKVRDYYREIGNVQQGLIVTAFFLGIITFLTALSIAMIQDSSAETPGAKPVNGIKDVARHTLGSKSFLLMLLFNILWLMASSITNNFFGIYKLNELQYNLGTIQIFNTVSNIVAMVLARPMGKLADRRSHSLCLKFALMGHIVAFTTIAFTTPETAWLVVVHAVISGIAGLVISSSFYNLLLEHTGPAYYMYGNALITCFGNLAGFAFSFFGAWLLETIQSAGNSLFGIRVYPQQILSAVSALMTLFLLAFAHFILTKLPKQKLPGTNEG